MPWLAGHRILMVRLQIVRQEVCAVCRSEVLLEEGIGLWGLGRVKASVSSTAVNLSEESPRASPITCKRGAADEPS